MAIANLGYLHFSEIEAGAWHRFATEVLGLMAVERGDFAGKTFLRADEAPFRIMASQGDTDRLLAAGWQVASEQTYREIRESLTNDGITIEESNDEQRALRCVTDFFSVRDPSGNLLEIYHGRTIPQECSTDFCSPMGIERFITGDMGLGHVVVPAPAMKETHQFYANYLGFGVSDDLRLPPPAEGAPEQQILFLHANNPRHHSLALYNFPFPTGIVHMMLEVDTVDQVGLCLDRVEKAGLSLMASLGRHCNDNMLSFYVKGPGDIAVEFGCDGLQLDWNNFIPTQSTEGDIWGHAYQMP